jgi:membrane-bound ClpP family serine protease
MGVGRRGFQAIQVAGALLILLAFAAAQASWMDQKSAVYLTLNLVGSAILGVQATMHKEWGFVLLEGAWALISAAGLVFRS